MEQTKKKKNLVLDVLPFGSTLIISLFHSTLGATQVRVRVRERKRERETGYVIDQRTEPSGSWSGMDGEGWDGLRERKQRQRPRLHTSHTRAALALYVAMVSRIGAMYSYS